MLPANAIVRGLGLKWRGNPWQLHGPDDELASASICTDDETTLWIAKDGLTAWLNSNDLALIWTLVYEAVTVHSFRTRDPNYNRVIFRGAATLDENEIVVTIAAEDERLTRPRDSLTLAE